MGPALAMQMITAPFKAGMDIATGTETSEALGPEFVKASLGVVAGHAVVDQALAESGASPDADRLDDILPAA